MEVDTYKPKLIEYVNKVTTPSKNAGKDMYNCPLCGSGCSGKRNSDGAFHVTDEKWYCHACNRGGDIFTLCGAIHGLNPQSREDFPKILEILSEELMISGIRTAKALTQSKTEKKIKKVSDPEIAKTIEIAAAKLKGSPAEEYLKGRGFTDETISRFRFGYDESSGRVVIPYPGMDYYTKRLCRDAEKYKYLYPENKPKPLFIVKDSDSDYYFITEGQFDAVSMIQAGAKNVIALGGGSYKLLGDMEISGAVIVADHDPEEKRDDKDGLTPGERTAKNIMEFLAKSGIASVTIYPPAGCKDSNDILRLFGEDALLSFLKEGQEKLPDEGLKAQTVSEWERPIPFEQVELPEFPVEALPERARRYVEAVAEALQVPVDMPGTAALAVMACCTQGKYYVEPKPNWTEPVNLYAVIIAEPAERKSAVTSLMTKPIKNYESNYNASHTEDIEANQSKKRILQKERDNLERLLADPKKEHTYEQEQRHDEVVKELSAFEEMSFLRLYVDDVTPEALTLFMDQNGGCASILSAEGGIFDQLTGGMYSKTVNIDVFLKAHAGDSIRVDRITRSCNTINNPALTMLLAIQPNVLCGLMQNETFRGRGLTARFLYTMPKTLVGKRQYHTAEIPISARLDYEGMVENLLSEYLNPTTENPAKITLSADASEKLEGFFMELEPQLQNEFNNFSEWAGKLCGAVVRIAGLLCRADAKRNELQDDSFTLEVDGETMTRAIALGRYYLKHAEAAFLLMGADPIVKRCEYVLQAIKKEGKAELSQRDIMRLCRSFKKKDELIPVLDRLCEYGYLRPKGETEKRTGRPVSQQYEINPAVITQNS